MRGEGRFRVAWIAEDLAAIAAGCAAAPGTEGREVAPHHDMEAVKAMPCVTLEDLYRTEVTAIHEPRDDPGTMRRQPLSACWHLWWPPS